jgi:hypothetical protein
MHRGFKGCGLPTLTWQMLLGIRENPRNAINIIDFII